MFSNKTDKKRKITQISLQASWILYGTVCFLPLECLNTEEQNKFFCLLLVKRGIRSDGVRLMNLTLASRCSSSLDQKNGSMEDKVNRKEEARGAEGGGREKSWDESPHTPVSDQMRRWTTHTGTFGNKLNCCRIHTLLICLHYQIFVICNDETYTTHHHHITVMNMLEKKGAHTEISCIYTHSLFQAAIYCGLDGDPRQAPRRNQHFTDSLPSGLGEAKFFNRGTPGSRLFVYSKHTAVLFKMVLGMEPQDSVQGKMGLDVDEHVLLLYESYAFFGAGVCCISPPMSPSVRCDVLLIASTKPRSHANLRLPDVSFVCNGLQVACQEVTCIIKYQSLSKSPWPRTGLVSGHECCRRKEGKGIVGIHTAGFTEEIRSSFRSTWIGSAISATKLPAMPLEWQVGLHHLVHTIIICEEKTNLKRWNLDDFVWPYVISRVSSVARLQSSIYRRKILRFQTTSWTREIREPSQAHKENSAGLACANEFEGTCHVEHHGGRCGLGWRASRAKQQARLRDGRQSTQESYRHEAATSGLGAKTLWMRLLGGRVLKPLKSNFPSSHWGQQSTRVKILHTPKDHETNVVRGRARAERSVRTYTQIIYHMYFWACLVMMIRPPAQNWSCKKRV
ncbi:hypothetical protein VP01_294g1 [Puccinia sorghi]|uniref:Uncharacterized protein n=1 Tax=Puccinia sorghi TaxID=27349 RepID=A0A0L6V119_9BASI|nr:hypothetical protein VP01_294g1 [Puccinia sorghi]